MSERLFQFFALAMYSLTFLAFLMTLLILGYQGVGYLMHGVWIEYDIEHFLQQFAWKWYLQYMEWIISRSDEWIWLTTIGRGVLEMPISLITFILGVMGWGIAAAADPKDRIWGRSR